MFQTITVDQKQSGRVYRFRSVDKADVMDLDKAWREALRKDADRLYNIASSFKGDLHGEIATNLLTEAESIYSKIEHFQHTNDMFAPRWHLLNASSDVISALQAAIVNNDNLAKAYMNAAKIELGFYDIELTRSGAF